MIVAYHKEIIEHYKVTVSRADIEWLLRESLGQAVPSDAEFVFEFNDKDEITGVQFLWRIEQDA